MRTFSGRSIAGLALVGLGIWALAARRRQYDFAGKNVLITGGSRGLGLELAREFVLEGARVAICARTLTDVRNAEAELRQLGGTIYGDVCDVADLQQVQALVSHVTARWGPIDVLVNNAGVIQVGPVECMTLGDCRRAMDVHYWGPLHTMHAVLGDMRKRGAGRIVNIASIGGKIAVPHLVPYCASKFALVGLSAGMRRELARYGVSITTVCPGLMRTGSPRHALFKGRHESEFAWFSIGDALPVASVDSRRAARRIVEATRRGDSEVIVPAMFRLAVWSEAVFPGAVDWVMRTITRLLPAPGGIGLKSVEGEHSQSSWSPSWLTTLGDRAAIRNNELR